ncbi:SDR family oxidoreductase [Pseudoduganella albidiflava]|uniref:SDR family oxidoreductase n=1 Tax=Pseudoduganella albidiflava TaxID=321983 RepID=A0A411X0D7_9BURK|nr:SDR family oxidoreductase [Pseudoduganella albidiflava]QBI02420.1 SDR family oxidoreductase [Pseudoduganella albidiflava]GGY42992.1 short-chain dehydrogenase/reductase [Pseudoduganella albidiflava]
MNTVLITGCSSGFGLEIARHFLERDWKVVATMRTPDPALLPRSDRLRIVALDVTDAASIRAAIDAAGAVDVLVNNAGIGMLNPLEAITMASAREVFETNTLGTIAMTQAVLPAFRARGAGVIVNVTSTVTLAPRPLLSVYTASKAAVNAFTESLALELEPLGIRAHLVLPGRAPDTRFGAGARSRMQGDVPQAYRPFVDTVFAGMQAPGPVTLPEDVARAVWRVVTEPAAPLRVPAGEDAEALAATQKAA